MRPLKSCAFSEIETETGVSEDRDLLASRLKDQARRSIWHRALLDDERVLPYFCGSLGHLASLGNYRFLSLVRRWDFSVKTNFASGDLD